MIQKSDEPKLLFPALQRFYELMDPIAWVVIRFAIGWNLFIHGYPKFFTRGPSAYIKAFNAQGFDPALPWIYIVGFIECFGGLALIFGLFTRFFAAAAAIELLVITILYWNNGFNWMNRGYEYVLMWGLVCFAVALKGGGRYSVDRLIGREL